LYAVAFVVEFGAGGGERLGYCESFGGEIVVVALVVDEWCRKVD
jgi:hypothetical protein